MKIVFMGTPEIAAMVLKSLIGSKHQVMAVVTQPDRPNKRGNEISYTPVKSVALENGIEVLQPEKASDPAFVEKLEKIAPDAIVVVAFGQILKKNVLELPRFGCINVHGSLLPKYRGAAPIQWAVINGDSETGVTIMRMDAGIDTGDIILQEKIALEPDETAGSLFDKMGLVSGPVLLKALDEIEAGKAVYTKQGEEGASYVGILKKNMGRLSFHHGAKELESLIRGLIPWPGAYTFVNGKMLKLWKTCISGEEEVVAAQPGQIRIVDNAFFIGTEDRPLQVLELQLEGKKRMAASDFIRGASIEDGSYTE